MVVEEAMEGHNLIIKLINCNSDSNHEQFCFALQEAEMALLGGGQLPPPRYVVKKGTVLQFFSISQFNQSITYSINLLHSIY